MASTMAVGIIICNNDGRDRAYIMKNQGENLENSQPTTSENLAKIMIYLKIENFFEKIINFVENKDLSWIKYLRDFVEFKDAIKRVKNNKEKVNLVNFFLQLVDLLKIIKAKKVKQDEQGFIEEVIEGLSDKDDRKINEAKNDIIYAVLKLKDEEIFSKEELKIIRKIISSYSPWLGYSKLLDKKVTSDTILELFGEILESVLNTSNGGNFFYPDLVQKQFNLIQNEFLNKGRIKAFEGPFAFLKTFVELGILPREIAEEKMVESIEMTIEKFYGEEDFYKGISNFFVDEEIKDFSMFLEFIENQERKDHLLASFLDAVGKAIEKYIAERVSLYVKNPAPYSLDEEKRILGTFSKYILEHIIKSKNSKKDEYNKNLDEYIIKILEYIKEPIKDHVKEDGYDDKYFEKNMKIFVEIIQAFKNTTGAGSTEIVQKLDKILLDLFDDIKKTIEKNAKDDYQIALRNKHLFDSVINAIKQNIIDPKNISELLRQLLQFNINTLKNLFACKSCADPLILKKKAAVGMVATEMCLVLSKLGVISWKEFDEVLTTIYASSLYGSR